jgi:hypothetical protein
MTSTSTTAAKPAKSPRILHNRVAKFLAAPKYGLEVTNVLGRLAELGRVAVFGGALRDLALYGPEACPSDIDRVIECEEQRDLAHFLTPFQPRRNRFGGFRFRTERWSFDAWCFHDTWAVREGLVEARYVDDLVRTTFFDWDALLYVHASGTVKALPDYFNRLGSLTVDVNLAENPNPLGNMIRALRIFALGRACLGRRLMLYVWEQLSHFADQEILGAEMKSFGHTYLSLALLSEARARLSSALERGEPRLPGSRPVQLELGTLGIPDGNSYCSSYGE